MSTVYKDLFTAFKKSQGNTWYPWWIKWRSGQNEWKLPACPPSLTKLHSSLAIHLETDPVFRGPDYPWGFPSQVCCVPPPSLSSAPQGLMALNDRTYKEKHLTATPLAPITLSDPKPSRDALSWRNILLSEGMGIRHSCFAGKKASPECLHPQV